MSATICQLFARNQALQTMNDDDFRPKPANDRRGLSFSAGDPTDTPPGGQRREPVFTDFDEDEDYEESDRDTDFASAYEDDELDDEDLADPEEEALPSATNDRQQRELAAGSRNGAQSAGKNPWQVRDSLSASSESDDEPSEYDDDPESELFEDEDLEEELEAEQAYQPEPDTQWDQEEGDSEERDDYDEEPAEGQHRSVLGLVVVGIVALVLLAAGGYGVIQQRSAAEEEIRQLQATLATAASPAEVAASRESVKEMEALVAESLATIDTLTLENRRLTDTVAGLENQLATQKPVTAPTPTAKAAPVPTAKPAAAKAQPKPASPKASGVWFVNFSSYSQRSVAEGWARKLTPAAGEAVVVPSSVDGKTFYRVRIVGLADRGQAQTVAAQLQSAHKLPPLWVGKE